MRVHPGKLLLFGEHAVLQGSQALAMPLFSFEGSWVFGAAPSAGLLDWLAYLKAEAESGPLRGQLDLLRLERDLERGMYFASNIPQGYGAGSSGALCAALYASYALHAPDADDQDAYPALRQTLGRMESFFHGTSSGADPLVSYLERPLLFDHHGAIHAVRWEAPTAHALFLLDTGKPRHTAPLVEAFRTWCREEAYLRRVLAELIPATEDAIAALLQGREAVLFDCWRQISLFQYRYMQDMILPEWRSLWLEALSSDTHALKLCGAGGGGFVLGISGDPERTAAQYEAFGPIFL